MILATHPTRHRRSLFSDLGRVLRTHLRARDEPVTTDDALVRALCHDMQGSLTGLESALRQVLMCSGDGEELLCLAREHVEHLTSLLRTAEATGGALPRRAAGGRTLRDVVSASVAASGLPRDLLTVLLDPAAGDIRVGDARLQRILVNLLENAHRHGAGAPVRLVVAANGGWVELALRQSGVPASRVAGHLATDRPPGDLTGLGLWSVQRQTRELGGQVLCEDDGGVLTLRVQVPDR